MNTPDTIPAGNETIPVSIIIPAHNEEGPIGRLVAGLKALYPDFDIIVVDDGSTDRTAEEVEAAGGRVYRHPYNMGNGAAIKSGIRLAKGDILVFMDADGQHDPRDIAGMVAEFPKYDMVIGARRFRGDEPFVRSMGNRIYNRLASYVAKFQIQDLTSGFRAVKSEIAREFMYLFPNGYSYPTTLTLAALRSGRPIKYIPIRVRPREAGVSNIRLMRDGMRFLMIILKISTLYSPMRIFLPVSLLTFVLGLFRYAYSYISEGRFTNMSALLFVTSIIIFMLGLVSDQICQMRFERSWQHPLTGIPEDQNENQSDEVRSWNLDDPADGSSQRSP